MVGRSDGWTVGQSVGRTVGRTDPTDANAFQWETAGNRFAVITTDDTGHKPKLSFYQLGDEKCENVSSLLEHFLFPQTDLSVGVLTVLYKGPWVHCGFVDAAVEHVSL